MEKKGDWWVGDSLIKTKGLDLDVPGEADGFAGGYRAGMVAVLMELRDAVPLHALNAAFEKAVERFADHPATKINGRAENV